jgi:hypothetical protein
MRTPMGLPKVHRYTGPKIESFHTRHGNCIVWLGWPTSISQYW